jgi:nucleoside-diphosphate-sugar epimerase
MKILFTGCSGFIGSAVLKEAIKKYGQKNIVLLSSKKLENNINVVIHNEYSFNSNIFIDNKVSDIDVLVHIGAFIPKEQNESNDVLKCYSNITNTKTLLYTKLPYLKKIIYLSTSDVYDNADIISEDTMENPISLYGFSKLYCEKMVKYFSEKHKLVYQILRIGHVFGPGEEKYKKIIPVTISKLLHNEELEIFGDGQSIRTFIYIDDVVRAILHAIELSKSAGIINVVGEKQFTIEGIVKELITIHNHNNISIKYIPTTIGNKNLIFNNSKLKNILLNKFTPILEGLQKEYLYMKGKYAREYIL